MKCTASQAASVDRRVRQGHGEVGLAGDGRAGRYQVLRPADPLQRVQGPLGGFGMEDSSGSHPKRIDTELERTFPLMCGARVPLVGGRRHRRYILRG